MSAIRDQTWGVRVNEVGIFANRLGAEWWAQAIGRWELSGRAVCVGLCLAGGVWFLPGGEKDDAAWMRDHIIEHGVHPKMVTVTTLAKAERERGEREARRRARGEAFDAALAELMEESRPRREAHARLCEQLPADLDEASAIYRALRFEGWQAAIAAEMAAPGTVRVADLVKAAGQ